ncbi:DEAD/DEAH box helicase [Tepidibacter hydrothermalis]|uniref:DEAD/DEAH box helicase n=1 Tax=Tepidibacter hydrothermalis TaxID=3036126 RepID=A0ABY8EGU6_9FIRM|nr:DEAD/DEAH box helicase [Tepidibacter hydrothermalis]WFD12170.1 DEAD/DEAH box helicase [Tepidibacter hydrothermalis]
MQNKFKQYNLHEFIVENLTKSDIVEPTKVQNDTIPLILEGKDVIGKARTGTGKTLSYLIPMVQKIDSSKNDLQMLVLAPSKELSIQIQQEAQRITQNSDIKTFCIVEGMKIEKQIEKLKQKPHLIVATPGRLLHLISLKKIKMHNINTIALDEVDQILEKGFISKVQGIIKTTLRDRQLLSFSATISQESSDILNNIMKKPEFINLDHIKPIPTKIKHQYMISTARRKTDTLVEILKTIKPSKSLVFINKNENVDRFVKDIHRQGFSVGGIQTRTKNQDRQHLLSSFQKGKLKILVTTDLFTRGMDFQDVTHIFNMDLPLDKVDYLHRAGRTGRMNKDGVVINIVRDREKFIMYKMMKQLNISQEAITIADNKIVLVDNIIKRKKRKY